MEYVKNLIVPAIFTALGSAIGAGIYAMVVNFFKKQEKEQKPLDYKILWFKSDMYLKKCMILYRTPNGVLIKLLAKV